MIVWIAMLVLLVWLVSFLVWLRMDSRRWLEAQARTARDQPWLEPSDEPRVVVKPAVHDVEKDEWT